MKRVILWAIVLGVLLGRVHPYEEEEFAGGNGTPNDPYLVKNAEHVNNIRHHRDAHFRQIEDITLEDYAFGEGWNPVGERSFPDHIPFTGTYDGQGYTISDLTINRPDSHYLGLFGYIDGAELRNMALVDVWIEGRHYVGGLVGWIEDGVVESSFATGEVNGGYYVGVLVGRNGRRGIVRNSYARGTANGEWIVGVLMGGNTGNIDYCYSSGEVHGEFRTGGLLGGNWGTILYSYYNSETTGYTDQEKGTPCQDKEMRLEATFENWDFDNVWSIIEGQSYPFLQQSR